MGDRGKRQTNYRWKAEVIRVKREAAEKRAEEYAKRSVKEQLELITLRIQKLEFPGIAQKERAKLEAKL